ncbi:putative transcription factor C2H2 family [Lupinus albus]|uniref:RING-type E3 ubiquitin transferase n=1 Tax=Lupinus albus TaxID=3870 RepID=A0A6A4PRB0_LUPAL|nr:putative transcription factor C2H2 family [Lupinus albus]
MATSLSLNLTFSFYYFFIFLILINFSHTTQQQTSPQITPNDNNNTLPTEKTSPPPPSSSSSSFKPGISVVIGVLTTMFSVTFLLLLYIKHCYTVSNDNNNNTTSYNSTTTSSSSYRGGLPPLTGRKNSGIDRSVIESLPTFRFGSLMGQKEGLDCAVCLTKFEGTEVLRLLPKCKHAFHVECVDTWLDAHSTCPLCRYRVDPEDIFLLHDTKTSHQNEEHVTIDVEKGRNSLSQISESSQTRRISGRHSWVGEREGDKILQTTSFLRRSLDSETTRRKSENGVGVGRFMRQRKDGMLLLTEEIKEKEKEKERRIEQRINIVSPPCMRSEDERWSDVQPLDLLYLTSEMIISNGGRKMMTLKNRNDDDGKGEIIINKRSVSEITGLSRFLRNRDINNNDDSNREKGLVSRWLAWISITSSQTET